MHKLNFNKWQIKQNESTKQYAFLFKIYNQKTDGIIFLITSLGIPLIALFLFRFVGQMGTVGVNPTTNGYLQMGYMMVSIISAVVGLIIFYLRDAKLLIKSGLIIFYLFQLIPIGMSLLGSLILAVSFGEQSGTNEIAIMLGLWFQIIGEIIVVIYAIFYVTDLKQRIITTFKTDWKRLLMIVTIGTIVMVGICIFAWGAIVKGTIFGQQSNNQDQLEKLLKSSNKLIQVFYIISLFCLTILVAPITEELATRNAWYVGSGNRITAWLTSALFFAMIHVSTGDLENLLNYFIAGFILSSIFNLTRGNVTYSWLIHGGYNLTTLIIILATKL